MRERALWELPASYGAVGATKSADVVVHPPAGFRAAERRKRIGQGAHRFEWAWVTALTWGIQRSVGIRVDLVDTPESVVGEPYLPVMFDDSGAPIPSSTIRAASGEATFTSDGTSIVRAGDSVVLRPRWAPLRMPVRVVYVIDEPSRKGFAYGTIVGNPISGEELILIERDADDAVWFTIRAFSRPGRWFARLFYPVLRIGQAITARRYLRSLTGRID